jgi:excisionase family DNA binding protein
MGNITPLPPQHRDSLAASWAQAAERAAALRALAKLIDEAPPEELPALLAALAAIATGAAARFLAAAADDRTAEHGTDRNLGIAEAAQRLGVSKDFLYRRAKRLPFTRRIGRRLLFSANGLEAWNRRRARGS